MRRNKGVQASVLSTTRLYLVGDHIGKVPVSFAVDNVVVHSCRDKNRLRSLSCLSRKEETDFYVSFKILDSLFVVFITWPFAAIDGDLSRAFKVVLWNLFSQVFHLVDILLSNSFALSSIVQVIACYCRSDTEKYEPIPRRKSGSL